EACGIQKCQRPAGPGVVVSGRCNSVQTLATALFALNLLGVTLDGGSCLALALGGRLLVELAAADFGQYAGLFAGALEATQSYVEGFVLFNFDGGHPGRTFQLPGVVNALLQAALEDVGFQGLRMLPLRLPECKGFIEKRWPGQGVDIIMRAFIFCQAGSGITHARAGTGNLLRRNRRRPL